MDRQITPWGQAQYELRNLQLVHNFLNGSTLVEAAKDAGITGERARQIIAKCCRVAWERDEALRRDFPHGLWPLGYVKMRALSTRLLPLLVPANAKLTRSQRDDQ